MVNIDSVLTMSNKTIIKVELEGPIEPKDLKVVVDEVERRVKALRNFNIVIVSGRMPTWLYAAICHRLGHIVKTLSIFDPKLLKAVVVYSHCREFQEGDLLDIDKDELEQLL